jgi:hypothetical protein
MKHSWIPYEMVIHQKYIKIRLWRISFPNLEALINDLNTYYYENIIPNADKRKPIMDEVDRDLKDHLEDDLRPITREITKEYKRIKNIRGL